MTQYQIAAYVLSGALRTANQTAGEPIDANTLIALSGAVSTAVSINGHKDKKAIRKTAMKITPDFKLIEKDFFAVLEEAPIIAELTRDKDYDRISEFILEYSELSPEDRLQLYMEEYALSSFKFWKIFRIVCLCLTILAVLMQIGFYIFNPESRKEFCSRWKKVKEHAEKAKKHAQNFRKAIKFLSELAEK